MTSYQLNKEFVNCNKMLKYFGWFSIWVVAATGLALAYLMIGRGLNGL